MIASSPKRLSRQDGSNLDKRGKDSFAAQYGLVAEPAEWLGTRVIKVVEVI